MYSTGWSCSKETAGLAEETGNGDVGAGEAGKGVEGGGEEIEVETGVNEGDEVLTGATCASSVFERRGGGGRWGRCDVEVGADVDVEMGVGAEI